MHFHERPGFKEIMFSKVLPRHQHHYYCPPSSLPPSLISIFLKGSGSEVAACNTRGPNTCRIRSYRRPRLRGLVSQSQTHLGAEPGTVVFALAGAKAPLDTAQHNSGQLRSFTAKYPMC